MNMFAAISDNQRIASRLREAADRLEGKGDNAFRAAAFRRAAETVDHCARPLREIFESRGFGGLEDLPGIGPGIAGAIVEMLATGRWMRLERLRRTHHVPDGPERVITYFDEEGEHACVVVERRP